MSRDDGLPETLRFDSLAIHAGYKPDAATLSRTVPIYQTTAYRFKSAAHAASLFALEEEGNIYTRIGNPTTEVLEKRMAALEGGVAAVAFASGHAAVSGAILNIAGAGDEIVSSSALYGGTANLFAATLPRYGITVTFVDSRNPENFRKAVTPRTKAFYGEVIGNPDAQVLDIQAVGDIAAECGVPLVVDATFAPPCLCRSLEWGANIVLHSATKFLGGHGTSMAGIVVDGGRFDWDNGRFPSLSEPDPSYHDLRYTATFGAAAFAARLRSQVLRDFGACLSPFNSFLILQGIETLPLRMERHCSNALAVARFLERHPAVAWVNYPGLSSHPDASLAEKYLPKGAGSIFTFGVKGGLEAGRRFIDTVRLFSLVANVGDARSLVIHPASTTHSQLDSAQLAAAGVREDTIRLSIGLEDPRDLLEDLDQALRKATDPGLLS